MAEFRLETDRLVLRDWRDDDIPAHQVVCHDSRVVATLGPPPSLEESHEIVARQVRHQADYGFCFWVMELRASPGLAGWCGFQPGKPPFEGETEIGWAVRPELWRRGLAHEAARACLDWAWANTSLDHIVAITSQGNAASRGLMARLGMTEYPAEAFDHPALPEGSPLHRHVLYRIARPT